MAAPRYEIQRREHHGGGLFELEITVHWDVIELATGAVVRTFRDESWARYDGGQWAEIAGHSIADVTLTDDGAAVEIRFNHGVVERVALP